MLTVLVIVLVLGLAAVNGANDNGKGVATLAGSGVTDYRKALWWAHLSTFAGAIVSGLFATKMLKLFSKGIIDTTPTPAFTLAVLSGVTAWILLATIFKLPVSTTHGIIGSLLGAGLVFSPGAIVWSALVPRLVVPLLLSIGVSYTVSAMLNGLFRTKAECLCAGVTMINADAVKIPQLVVINDTSAACKVHKGFLQFHANRLHWLTSGAVGFSRGLNDTPKIVAIALAALGGIVSPTLLLISVSVAMLAGGIWASNRVVKKMAEDVVKMNHTEGFLANLATSLLVGVGANLGWPMSTTHVSTGAISGIAGTKVSRLGGKTLRDFILAWTLTPIVAGLVAAVSFWIISKLK